MPFYSSDYKITKQNKTKVFKVCIELPLLIFTIFKSWGILKGVYFLFTYIQDFPGAANEEAKAHVLNQTLLSVYR